MDRLRQEHTVDPACAGPGDNVGHNPQPQPVILLDPLEQVEIDSLRAGAAILAGQKVAARAGELPQLLGDAMHIDRKADPAVANECNSQFFLAHRSCLAQRSTDGNCVGSFGELNRDTTGLSTRQLNSVGGVTLDSAGNVYVADAGAGRILRFAPFPAPAIVQPAGVVQPQSGGVQQGAGDNVEVTLEPAENTLEITPEVTAAG